MQGLENLEISKGCHSFLADLQVKHRAERTRQRMFGRTATMAIRAYPQIVACG